MRLRRNRGTVAERPAIETDEEPGAGDDAGTAPATTEPTEPATSRSPAPQTRPAATAEPVAPAGEPGTPVGARTRAAPPRREPVADVPGARTHIPASRGVLVGTLLVILGVWGALIPLVGPYFNYEFGSDTTWDVTWQRVWLDILPGAALVLGGLILIGARTRPAGLLGAWIALVGGIWFAAGPVVGMLWHGTLSAYAPIGTPIGSKNVKFLELLGYFYGLGALATALASFALGRLSIVAVRDVQVAAERTGATAPAAGI